MRAFLLICLSGFLGCLQLIAAPPVLRIVRASAGTQTNLVRNPGFEVLSGNRLADWSAYESGFEAAPKAGRNGSNGIACQNANAQGSGGASQSLSLDRATPAPLIVRGWSKAENVGGSPDNNYSIYVDIVYQDGSPLWGQTANFRCGTHDWEMREVMIFPEKPVKRLTVYCLFRGHSGRVWFDDVVVEELRADQGTALFQGAPVWLPTNQPAPAGPSMSFATQDGLRLKIVGQSVVDGSWDFGSGTGGFMARDVARDSDFFGFANGACPDLNLKITAEIAARPDHLVVQGRLADTSGLDRAITLVFALPVSRNAADRNPWRWGDDIRRERSVNASGDFANLVSVRCGATGAMSLYPVAALRNDREGLALGLDMAWPAVYRLGYQAGLQQLYLAFDFGLVKETSGFPAAADFRFVIYRFDPRWGFRGAWQKYMQIFPEYFLVRSKEQGLWMPFTDVATVQDWQDFGFRYHEGNNNVPFDDANGILSFRYTEPMTWWMSMDKQLPRTPEAAIKVRDELAKSGRENQRVPAQVTRAAGMLDEAGEPCLLFRDTPWCDGAVWSLNPNPHLPGKPNFADWRWNDSVKRQLYGPDAKGELDGEYLDSLEGYVTADLNFRREHFAHTTVPLTFDRNTKRPVLFKGLAVFEFTKWICDDLHRMNKLTFANGVPYRFTFLCPWLDVMGTETDWHRGGKYVPPSDSTMNLWRTMTGAKPYLLLMNTRYDEFTPDLVEKYFQRSLFYGFYPSMFSHNASEDPYWKNPRWYNRDRHLFKKYIPLVKMVAEAGWQPVTGASCDNRQVWLERFGSASAQRQYLTVFNDSPQPQTATLKLDLSLLPQTQGIMVTDLLSARSLGAVAAGQWSISLQPQEVAVYQLDFQR